MISRPGLALFIGAARRVRNGFAGGEICSTVIVEAAAGSRAVRTPGLCPVPV